MSISGLTFKTTLPRQTCGVKKKEKKKKIKKQCLVIFLARFVPRGGRLRADQFVGPLLELVVAEKLDVISGREDVRGRGKLSTPFGQETKVFLFCPLLNRV